MLLRPSRTLVIVSIATAFSLLGDQVLYSVLPVYFEQFGLAPFQVGILLSANRWVRLLTNQLAHWTHQFVRPELLLPSAFGLGAVTTAMYLDTTSFVWLLAARLLWGLSWSFIRHIGVLAIMSETRPEQTGQVMGYYNGGSRLGSVAGLFGGALLVEALGYSPAIVILALVSTVAIVLGLRVRHFAVDAPPSRPHVAGASPDVVLLGLAFVLGTAGPGLVTSTLGHVLVSRMGASVSWQGFTVGAASLTGAILGIRYVFDTIGAPVLGAIGDRIGLRRTGATFLIAGAAAMAVAAATGSTVVLIACIAGYFICDTALNASVAGTAAKRGSRTFSRYVTSNDVGSAMGPLLGWSAIQMVGKPTLGLLLAAALFALAALAIVRMR